ncbi:MULTISPECIES: diguanylate cyclase [unclassified Sporosarcina]|uniref:diguanylate cyclase n=1 Tax=unclassified Sporosarcina TaxID=2647733 RepID=UPI000C166B45|nr:MULTISPECIES: diguanylate cyclase [unclassified Sporosarcina]PID15946.1 diguanylate cyclase [Sporosarcina sp. P34]PID26013.1 diguanylate cyclase [Sporosarcina sp. P7]
MSQKKYQKMLAQRTENIFEEWKARGSLTERELYYFLHKLKGTSGTIGLQQLSLFCASQLEILTSSNDQKIPVTSLENLKNRIRSHFDTTIAVKKEEFQLPDRYVNRLDQETFVLIIDQDLEFVSNLKELLEKLGAQVIISLNGKRGIEQFYSMRPSIVIIDAKLPDMTGFEVLDQIAEPARQKNTTLAISSEEVTKEILIETYRRGAMDLISKPFDMDIFFPYLFNRQLRQHAVSSSMITDSLTGVGNRRYFDETINTLAKKADQSEAAFSLVIIDLDHFKQVNDLYGHPAGDEVLRMFGKIIKEEKREGDYVCRYGGEEFALLFCNSKAEDTVHAVERIRAKFNNTIFTSGDETFHVTFSAGSATYEGNTANMISAADQALYEAKRSGRNQTVIYDQRKRVVKRKLIVIIVDDDSFIRQILQQTLLELKSPDIDITVKTYADGPSFLEDDWYSPDAYFIVLLDGVMPKMDGLEVLSRLKSDHSKTNVTVSMMTARKSANDIKAALWLGADDYIIKPFQPSEVLGRIDKLANRLFDKRE